MQLLLYFIFIWGGREEGRMHVVEMKNIPGRTGAKMKKIYVFLKLDQLLCRRHIWGKGWRRVQGRSKRQKNVMFMCLCFSWGTSIFPKHHSVATTTSGVLVGKSFLDSALWDSVAILLGSLAATVLSTNLLSLCVYSSNFPLQNLKTFSLKNLVLRAQVWMTLLLALYDLGPRGDKRLSS